MPRKKVNSRKAFTQQLHDADEKEKFEVVDSDVITYGWLLPGGYGVNCGWMDHDLVPDLLGLSMADVFMRGWVRKAGITDYEFYRKNSEAADELGRHLQMLWEKGHVPYRFRNWFRVDVIDEFVSARLTRCYQFSFDDFVSEGMSMAKLIRGKDMRYAKVLVLSILMVACLCGIARAEYPTRKELHTQRVQAERIRRYIILEFSQDKSEQSKDAFQQALSMIVRLDIYILEMAYKEANRDVFADLEARKQSAEMKHFGHRRNPGSEGPG